MKPVVKVLIVVAIVLVVVHIIKRSMDRDDETYIPFLQQEFETVPPARFVVSPVPLVVNDDVTAAPVRVQTAAPVLTVAPMLTQVATDLPAAVPAMVPTFVPSVAPAVISTRAP